MAIRRGGGQNLPDWHRSRSLKGRVYFSDHNGTLVASAWPKARGKPKSTTTKQQNNLFAATVRAVRHVDPNEREAAEQICANTAYTWRDILFMAMHGEYFQITGLADMTIQQQLDSITDQPGAMLYRGTDAWIALMPPGLNAVLAYDVATQLPIWTDPSNTGITELTGDVIAGPGSGSQAATLSETGVTPGTYLSANITVDGKGRIIAAENGAADTGITQLTGDVIAGPGSGSQAATLSDTGVTPGTYSFTNVTVDPRGRITAATSGALATDSGVGVVKVDGTTITVDEDGTISATGAPPGGPGTGFASAIMYPTPTISALALPNWRNQGSTAYTDQTQGVQVVPRNDAAIDNYAWNYRTPPTPPYTLEAYLAMTPFTSSDHGFGIGHSDGTKLEIIRIWGQNGGTAVIVTRLTDTTHWSSNPAATNLAGVLACGLKITVTSTLVDYYISVDGEAWTHAYQVTKSGSFLGATGYSELGVAMQYCGSAPAAYKILGWKLY